MLRLILTPLIAALLLAPLATAQEPENGCTESSPCDWIFDVDEDGFAGTPEGGWTFAQGDWVQVNLFNMDLTEQAHTITLDGYDRSWTLEPFQEVTSEPFPLHLDGEFTLRDDPTGDTASVFVAETPPVAEEGDTPQQKGDNTDGEDDALAQKGDPAYGEHAPERTTPPAGTVLVATALLAYAAAARRRGQTPEQD